MARQARKNCETNCYHVIARGVGQQIIFETQEDYRFFHHLMTEYALQDGILLGAYCLMSNHFHLLVHDKNGSLPHYMRKLMGIYAVYFNQKHDRNGHLFQDRYRSVPILTDTQYCTVVRYILHNPVKAGISSAKTYPWSSFQEKTECSLYMDRENLLRLRCNHKYLDVFLDQPDPAENEMYDFVKDDEWAERVACTTLQIKSGREVEKMPLKERNLAILRLQEKGLSVRQIQRITGVGRNTIQRAAHKENEPDCSG